MWERLLDWDKATFLALHGDMGTFADSVFWVASGKLTWVPLYLIILWFMYRKWGWKTMLTAGVFIALAVIFADQICNVFKYTVKKFRPTHTPGLEDMVHIVNGYRGGLYGTFSAHAATCFSIAIFTSKFFRNNVFTIFIYLWAAFVAYSRIYLGAHYPLDLIYGASTGLLVGFGMYKLFVSKYVSRFHCYRPCTSDRRKS